MRIELRRRLPGNPPAQTAFVQKIMPRHIVKELPSIAGRRKLLVARKGRLAIIRFPWRLEGETEGIARVTLTEGELFRLVELCRRDRSDDELLKAMKEAWINPTA